MRVDVEHALAAPAEHDYWRPVLPTFAGTGGSAAFREWYESARSLPPGVTDRAPFFRLLCLVCYLESVHVRAQHGPEETGRRAVGLRETTFELLAEIR